MIETDGMNFLAELLHYSSNGLDFRSPTWTFHDENEQHCYSPEIDA
jgi:hypothetical protein